MTARIARRLAWSLWSFMLLLVSAALVLVYLNRSTLNSDVGTLYPILVLTGLSYGTAGALIASRHSGNLIGWLFCLMGIGFPGLVFTEEYGVRGLVTAPGSLPAVSLIAYMGNWLWFFSAGPVILVFLLFPTGRPSSTRWRRVAWLAVGVLALGLVGGILHARPTTGINDRFPNLGLRTGVPNPLGVPALDAVIGVVLAVAAFGGIGTGFASVASLILRFRQARGEERQQLKWLAYTAGSAAASFVLFPLALFTENEILGGLFWLTITMILGLGIPVASGVAILKYRLYDLDIVIRKTVVLGALIALFTLVYLALVVGVGAAIGQRGNTALTFAGAAVVAILFQPVRTRARRLADRLVYGKRATPYEVLSEFSDRVAGTYSSEDVLPRMAQILAAGTGATRTRVWLRVASKLRVAASWPTESETPPAELALSDGELPQFPGDDRAFPVRHQDEVLGALTVAMPPSEPLTPSQEKLVQDLASQAGLVLRNVRLTEELLARLEELRASRQRLVRAQDEERRRLERNLHDGAQQQLVALAVKQRLVDGLIGRDPEKARQLLSELQADTAEAMETLRDLARGIYPPLLADRGLPEALRAQARKAPVPVEIEASGIDRYPQELEAAVYFCCLEALQNVAKYAEASRVLLRLTDHDSQLGFTVADDGRGYDVVTTPLGSGIQNMADRLAALGGSLEVQSQPGMGTTVTGRVPVRAGEPADHA